MHLSAQEEYGLRCLARLARHEGDEPVRIQDIAEAEGLSPEYVAKLMRILRNGGIVTSTRGAAGGYHLGRPASEITLWEAIEVLGGPFFHDSFCQSHPGALRDCVHTTNCAIRATWRTISSLLKAALSAITVEDLKREEESTLNLLSRDPAVAAATLAGTEREASNKGQTVR
ncbi:MAG: Rrf2 family transcriptional regulator [Candidatus Dadabacteria bacterium]|nr:MAG: Rrf2 family transcriptional regulator [Candidatus Dadabacteria bacterium]